ATPALTLARSFAGFVPTNVGVSGPVQAVTVTNTGSAALAVSSITSPLGDFAATHDCASVTVSASCTISIAFVPIAAGARETALKIISNAGNQSLTVSGTGVAGTTAATAYGLTVSKIGSGAGTVTSTTPAGTIN